MKRLDVAICLIFLFLFALPTIAFASATGLQFLEKDEQGILFSFESGDLLENVTEMGGQLWNEIQIEGLGKSTIVGSPQVSVATALIPLGPTDRIVAELTDLETITMTDIALPPAPAPEYRDGGLQSAFTLNESVYLADRFWPSKSIEVSRPAIVHGLRLSALRFYPIQYNPTKGEIRWIQRAKIRIKFLNDETENPLSDYSPGVSSLFWQMTSKLMSASDSMDSFTNEMRRYDGAYVIITDEIFLEALKPLVEWKSKKGLKVEVYTTTETGWTAQDIRSFLKDRYFEGATPVDYVLLFGDIDFVPTFYGLEDSPADHLYATLEGDDYLPDVILGRMPVNSPDEADIVVEKTLRYETAPDQDRNDWYSSAVAISGSDKVDDENADFCADVQKKYGRFDRVDELFDSIGNNDLETLEWAIDQGRSWITYFGHGSIDKWKSISPSYSSRNVRMQKNGGMLPVITSIACSNGAFDDDLDSFAEVWLKDSVNEGAAAVFAASRSTPFTYTDALGKAMVEGYYKQMLPTFGASAVYGKLKMYENFPEGSGSKTELVMQQFHVFGDPELNVWSAFPQESNVTYYTKSKDGAKAVTLTVKAGGEGLGNAFVHIYKDDELSMTGRTNDEGVVVFMLEESEDFEDMDITVTGRNVTPYMSDPLESEPDDDTWEPEKWWDGCGF